MASTRPEPQHDTFQIEDSNSIDAYGSEAWKAFQQILKPMASLKLTVALFLASIFIVLAGTFAQVNDDIWAVVHEYFRVDTTKLFGSSFPWFNFSELFVIIDMNIFFPVSFFPENPQLPDNLTWMAYFWPDGTQRLPDFYRFYFPKGWTIGIVMGLNLLAAHTVRFKVQAKGSRLTIGTVILALGAAFTFLVILSGSSVDGLQSKPLIDYENLRLSILTTLFGLCGATIYGTFALEGKEKKWLCGIGSLLLALTAVFIAQWQANDEASMRILYQLVKATLAALILLVGCITIFKRRAGVVLLHGGIALMMFYDVLVGVQHIESQMTIVEGESTNFSRDIREVEFAVIDRSGQSEDVVTVVSQSLIDEKGATISDPQLPFDLEVVEFFLNSNVRGLNGFGPNEVVPENLATKGIGTSVVASRANNVKGTDSGGRIDVPSLYVELKSKSGESLGTYLASSIFDLQETGFGNSQKVTVDGKSYEVALRFVRHYYDYEITLNDVQKNDYKGTSSVKDYSSFITLNYPEQNLKIEQRIWMNNPMRFAGKTFYQSSYGTVEGNKEYTTLQVVDNVGWMTPYVSCMIVWIGMMFHFGQTLLRYLGRRARTNLDIAGRQPIGPLDKIGWVTSAVICGGILMSVAMLARPPKEKADEFHIGTFGELPIWYKGRPMPIDSFARNALLRLSDYERYRDENEDKHQASEWLLKVMTGADSARDVHIFKIENKELIEALGLTDRERFTYSFNELLHSDKVDEIKEMGMLSIIRDLEGLSKLDPKNPKKFENSASDTPANERNLFQRKLIELARNIDSYVFLEFTVGGGRIIDLMEAKEGTADDQPAIVSLSFKLREFERLHTTAFNNQPMALVVPTHLDANNRPEMEAFQTNWETVTSAKTFDAIYDELKKVDQGDYDKPPALSSFISMIDAYNDGEVEKFNKTLAEYKQLLETAEHTDEDAGLMTKTSFEALYNRFGAFNLASWLYVFAGVLAALGWLFWPQVFQRASFWTIATIFVIHTAALIGRIYISGRPPVTNLYSSAIFIGWSVVFGGLILERISRLGVANLVGAVAGFTTLRIADGLASDGDTFVVLEAVLDTQFWLATHVVCITLGYGTTYLAGLLGMLYLILGICTPALAKETSDQFAQRFFGVWSSMVKDKDFGKEIARMTYGVLCFATFFSFVGTVLGGLWADDSWGRFWGWDPKENGALIIVLWNALVIHARWGNLVKDRGTAVLAVLGNAVVSWSWFGVNELGVGKHSYGFTEGVLAYLALFVMSQLIVASIGCLPKGMWMSKMDVDE